jgi:hypothetical protein
MAVMPSPTRGEGAVVDTVCAAFATMHSCSRPIKQQARFITPAALSARVMLVSRALIHDEGAGKAGRRSHPWSACSKKHAAEPQVRTGSSGLPCAIGFTAYTRSPRGPAFLPPSSTMLVNKHRELGLSNGRPGPHDFTVRAMSFVRV